MNRVPGHCVYDLDIRYVPGQDAEEITRQIRGVSTPAEVEVLYDQNRPTSRTGTLTCRLWVKSLQTAPASNRSK